MRDSNPFTAVAVVVLLAVAGFLCYRLYLPPATPPAPQPPAEAPAGPAAGSPAA
jgi:hypothetical protein